MKKKQKNIFIGVGVVFAIILLLGVLIYQPVDQNVSYYNDNELGLIKIKIGEESILSKLFGSQQAFFSTTTTTLGKSVTVSDYIPIMSSGTYTKENLEYANLYISINGNSFLLKSILANIPSGVNTPRIDVSYTPSQVGKYTAYTVVKFKNGETAETSRGNEMSVTTPDNECTKKPYFDSWSTKDSINGGVVQERDFYSVTSSCTFKLSSTEDRIVCNDGYVVSGTSSTIAVYTGVQKCEQTIIPPKVECDADITETCSDGTTVTMKTCASGVLVATGNSCSVVEIPSCEETNTCDISDGNQIDDDTDTDTDDSTDDGTDTFSPKSFFEKYESYFMYVGAGIVILLVLLIGYNFIKRR